MAVLYRYIKFLGKLVNRNGEIRCLSLVNLILDQENHFRQVQIKLAEAFADGQVTVVFQFQQIVFGKQSIHQIFAQMHVVIPLGALFRAEVILYLKAVQYLNELILRLAVHGVCYTEVGCP